MNLPFKMTISNDIEQWRHDTFWEKEPETIEWIQSFTDGIFLDIGANIGIYSLFCASLHPNMHVIAVEPFKANADRLNENVKLNKFENIVVCNFGIGDFNGFCDLEEADSKVGSSGHQICTKNGTCAVVRLSDFAINSSLDFNYIKIDTDGNEYDIISHAASVLGSQSLRSVLIEVNNNRQNIIDMFNLYGFTTDNAFNQIQNHSRVRRNQEGIAAENIIFSR